MVVDPTEMIDGFVPHDEYRDEMDMMIMSKITNIVQLQPISPFDMFGVSTTEFVEDPEWLANVVPIPKKDDKVSICVNFKDLNKAALKMTFLSHILIFWSIAP